MSKSLEEAKAEEDAIIAKIRRNEFERRKRALGTGWLAFYTLVFIISYLLQRSDFATRLYFSGIVLILVSSAMVYSQIFANMTYVSRHRHFLSYETNMGVHKDIQNRLFPLVIGPYSGVIIGILLLIVSLRI